MTSSREQDLWVARVLGVRIPETEVSDEGGLDPDDPLDLKNRLTEATRSLEVLKAQGDPALPDALTAHGLATTAVGARAENAGLLMDELEAVLARAKSAALGRKAKSQNQGIVEYAKLRIRWQNAQSAVLANLTDLGAALLSLPDVEALDDYEDLVEAVYDLPDLIPDFGRELDDVLDEARKPEADRKDLSEQALAIIADYRSAIEGVSELKALQAFSGQLPVGRLDLFDGFKAALDEIETEVSKVG